MSADTAASEYTVYRLYDADRHLLYVGATANWTDRRRGHVSKPWWPDVDESLTQLTRYASRGDVARAERDAIESESPKYNICGRTMGYRGYSGVPVRRAQRVAVGGGHGLDAVARATEARRIGDAQLKAADAAWRAAIKDAIALGCKRTEIAAMAGITRGRVTQIEQGRR